MSALAAAGGTPPHPLPVRIFVINLDRSPARFASISQQLSRFNLPFERISALDGSIPEQLETARANYSANLNKKNFRRALSNGEIACFASHRRAWKLIANTTTGGGVVLEDDALLSDDFAEAIALLQTNAAEWSALKLFTDKKRHFAGARKINGSEKFSIADCLHTPACTSGYAINKSAAQKLLSATEQFGRPVDRELQHWWKTGVRFQALLPHTVTLRSFPSDLESGTSRTKEQRNGILAHFSQQASYYANLSQNLLRAHGIMTALRALFQK